MKTSKQIHDEYKQSLQALKDDAIASITEKLKGRECINGLEIFIESMEDPAYAIRLYREDGRIYVDIDQNELDHYYGEGCETRNWRVSRWYLGVLNLFNLIDLLKGLEDA